MLAIFVGESDEILVKGEVGFYIPQDDSFFPVLDHDRPGIHAGYAVEPAEIKPAYIRVHMNLRSKNFTISTHIKGKGWRKTASANRILLRDVEFKVSEAGRQRAVNSGVRNVHAYAYGYLTPWTEKDEPLIGSAPVSYNPFKAPTFVTVGNASVYKAEEVLFSVKYGVQAWGIIN